MPNTEDRDWLCLLNYSPDSKDPGEGRLTLLNLNLVRMVDSQNGHMRMWFSADQKVKLDGIYANAALRLLAKRSVLPNGEPVPMEAIEEGEAPPG